jgi:Na+/H+-translocating membrane pyrophosphatase
LWTAKAALNEQNGFSSALRSAFFGASVGSWIVLAGILLLYTFIYLVMTTNRNTTTQFKYFLSCSSNPAFCGQTIAAQTMVAFCCGISCATFLYRLTAGIFAKAAEIGSELVHKLESDTLTNDKMKNGATISDKVGAVILDSGGSLLDITETMCLCMVAAQVLAEGDSARLSLTFMYPGCAILASLFSYWTVRCSDKHDHISERHVSSCWGFRYGLYTTHFLIFIFTVIMTGAVYDRYPFEKLRYADMRRTEG